MVDGMILVRIIAIAFVALAVIATVIGITREQATPEPRPVTPVTDRAGDLLRDPLREGQRRCQQLGQAAAGDPECLRVWSETRDRFLGRTPSSRTIEGR